MNNVLEISISLSLVAELFLAARVDLGLQRERSATAAAAVVVSSIGQIHFQEVGFWPSFGGGEWIPCRRDEVWIWSKSCKRRCRSRWGFSPSSPIISGLLEGALGSVRALSLRCWRGGAGKQSSARGLTPPRIATTCQSYDGGCDDAPTFRCINRS